MKTLKMFVALLLGLSLTGPAAAVAAQTPEELVHDASQRVMKILVEEHDKVDSDPQFLYGLVDEVILPMIDFEAMTKLTLGKHWRTATPEQRERFMDEYRSMLVRTYTKSLKEYTGARITYLPARENDGKSTVVYTEVDRGDGRPSVPVNYSLRYTGDQWLVYDVVIDGLSIVKNYRTSFNEEITQTSLQALIERLAESNRKGEELVTQ